LLNAREFNISTKLGYTNDNWLKDQHRLGGIKLTSEANGKTVINESSISFNSYETMADYYFECVDTKPFNAYYERPATLSLLPSVAGKKVLDAGCAAGWYSKWLLDMGADVTAIDFSPSMIEMTKKRIGDKADIIRADLNEPLSFIKDKSIDIVVSSLTLHYIKDWNLVMNEFNRVIKPLGTLIFSVHHPFMDFTYFNRENYFLTEIIEDEWETNKGKVKVQFYRRPLCDIISPVINAGFRIEKLIEPMPTEKFRDLHPQAYERLTQKPQFLFLRARKG
jgi:SAM-dependent methyltransferase